MAYSTTLHYKGFDIIVENYEYYIVGFPFDREKTLNDLKIKIDEYHNLEDKEEFD